MTAQGAGPAGLPRNLIDAVSTDADESRRTWIGRLPEIVKALEKRWALEVSEPFQPGGKTAWVAPARRDGHWDLVLKIGWRHPEAANEADGLVAWDGNGAVRLHASAEFDDTVALLVERCVPGIALASRPETEQDSVIAELLPRLWLEPEYGHRFRPLQLMCDEWANAFERKITSGRSSLDAGLAREGIALFRTMPATAERNVLLCTDLHADNVLAAGREPWLVIDPKPYVGDPTYDPLQHLLNCEGRLAADPAGLTRHIADLLNLEAERLLLWLFARCIQESPERPSLGEIAVRIAPR